MPLTLKKSHIIYHCTLLYRKYGIDNFSLTILWTCETENEVSYYEELYISQYRSNIIVYGKDFSYNLTNGGEKNSGHKHTEETIAKMKLAHQGKLHTEEAKKKIGDAHRGMKHSDDAKSKIREAFSGEKSMTAKINWKIVNAIREEYASNLFTYQQLADKYSISTSNIGSIITNKSWRI